MPQENCTKRLDGLSAEAVVESRRHVHSLRKMIPLAEKGCLFVIAVLAGFLFSAHGEEDARTTLSALERISDGMVSTQSMRNLCAIANSLPVEEEELRQKIYKTACAGLVSFGDMINFFKLVGKVRGGQNVFGDFMKSCEANHAEGKVCSQCHGKGYVVSAANAKQAFDAGMLEIIEAFRPKAEEEANKEEDLERKKRAFEASQREKGLVLYKGKWITVEEKNKEQEWQSILDEVNEGSISASFEVFQIYTEGRALCRILGTGQVFCLLFSAQDNRNVVEGERFHNRLYRCGTYSYVTVQNASRKVAMYAIDEEVAIAEVIRQRADPLTKKWL